MLSQLRSRAPLITILLFAQVTTARDLNKKDDPYLRAIHATRISVSESPKIDGELNDDTWRTGSFEYAVGFRQLTPREGEQATESTVVAIAYDDHAAYFAFWCYDSEPQKIIKELVRRDRGTEADQVSVRIDPSHDNQTGCRFGLNAAGVKRDERLFNDVEADGSWDAVWEGETRMQPWGWSAEYRIPYSILRFPEREEYVWGLSVTRYISRKQESVWWAFSPSTEGGMVSTFGHLTGMSGIRPDTRIEILPYSVAKLESEPKRPGNLDGRDILGNTGVDLKYVVSGDIALDATFNPDFGQVELDEPVLNLSAFETFYDEKRPFFLEGANLFDTEYSLFYSRRIGRAPRGWAPDAHHYISRPSVTTILGASKITGKVSERTSIAGLWALTQEEKAKYVDTLGFEKTAVIEPFASYSVLRFKRDFFRTSYVGAMTTSVGQKDRYPSHAGGIDWRLFTDNGVWGTSGQTLLSRTAGGEVGYATTMIASKEAGKHTRGAVGLETADKKVNLNALGYIQHNDFREIWGWFQYRFTKPFWILNSIHNNFNGWLVWNFDDLPTGQGWNYNFNVEFKNGWYLGGGFEQNAEVWDIFETRGNGAWNEPSQWSWWSDLTTNSSKVIWFETNPGSGEGAYGAWWANYVGIGLRPKSNIQITLGSNYERTFGVRRWVGNFTDEHTGKRVSVFALRDQDEITPRMSFSMNVTRDLSIQFSGQMLISALDHSEYRRYLGNESYAPLGDLATVESLESANDYNYRAFNSTLVFRWEYRPGSTIYLVWTQAREGDQCLNDLDISRDWRGTFSSLTPSENVFLVKANYWFSL
jgi:hypothetical protein